MMRSDQALVIVLSERRSGEETSEQVTDLSVAERLPATDTSSADVEAELVENIWYFTVALSDIPDGSQWLVELPEGEIAHAMSRAKAADAPVTIPSDLLSDETLLA